MKFFRNSGSFVEMFDAHKIEAFTARRLFKHLRTFCKILFITLVCLFLRQTAPAQEKPNNLHQWGAISSFHGLPSDRVTAIAQTADGILWFGTDKGLARYDGRRVQTVSAANLSNLKILSLKAAPGETLFIGTENGAFRLENDTFFHIKETEKSAVNSILIDKEKVYLSTTGGAIFECSRAAIGSSWRVVKILAEAYPITSLGKDGENLIAATHSRGLMLIGKNSASEIATYPRPFFINLLAADRNGKLWMGAQTRRQESGLFFSGDLFRPKRTGERLGTVNAIDFDPENAVWVGTQQNGAYIFRTGSSPEHFTFENTAGGLRSNEILSLFIDRESVVWFGTDKGVCRFDPHSPYNELIAEYSQSNFIRTIYRTSGGVLLAGTNRGLFYRGPEGVWTAVAGLETSPVFAIRETGGGRLSVGAADGFYQNVDLNNGAGAPLKLAGQNEADEKRNSVRAIESFKGKTYLAFYDHGLVGLEADGSTFNTVERISNPISLHAAENLWIGTADNGVFFFDGEKIRTEPALESLKKNAVWAIAGDEQNGLWIAAEKGLYRFKDGLLETILKETSVRDVRIGPDRKVIFAATENGLIQLSEDEHLGWVVSRLGLEQGLASSNTFAVLLQPDFTVYAATNRGISRFSTGDKKLPLLPVRILSRRLHQPDELISGIYLDYPQNSLALEVAALSSRTFPEQFQYAFYLRDAEGRLLMEKFSNDAQFLMENLAPGRYAVEVTAFDKNLARSEPLKFEFTVARAPFPWTSFLLSILLIIALVALVWAVISQRKIYQKSFELSQANRELNNARLDLANEAERERRRISRDLHDQTLADLRHLMLLADKFPTEPDALNVFRTEIENVSREIRRICEDLSPSVLENIGFTAALEWALTNEVGFYGEDRKIRTEFVCDENLEEKLKLPPAVQIQLYRIVQEVLSNITRHAEAENVKMTVKSPDENVFLLTIEDDGKGFEPENTKAEKGRGLANIKSRAELIKANTKWEKRDPKGMIFTLIKEN